MMTFDEVLSRFDVKSRSNGTAKALCPAHDDRNASLSISRADNGGVVFKCHAECETKNVLFAAGLDWPDIQPDDPNWTPTRPVTHRTAARPRLSETRTEPTTFWTPDRLKALRAAQERLSAEPDHPLARMVAERDGITLDTLTHYGCGIMTDDEVKGLNPKWPSMGRAWLTFPYPTGAQLYRREGDDKDLYSLKGSRTKEAFFGITKLEGHAALIVTKSPRETMLLSAFEGIDVIGLPGGEKAELSPEQETIIREIAPRYESIRVVMDCDTDKARGVASSFARAVAGAAHPVPVGMVDVTAATEGRHKDLTDVWRAEGMEAVAETLAYGEIVAPREDEPVDADDAPEPEISKPEADNANLDAWLGGEVELSDADVIAALADLPQIDYDKIRNVAAERLGCRVSTLDRQVTDHIDAMRSAVAKARAEQRTEPRGDGPALHDFYWLATDNKCIFAPTGELWPNASADRRLPAIPTGKMKKGSDEPETIPASLWLASNRPVEQQTWAPGEPQIIEDILVAGAGQIPKPGVKVFNLYKPPILKLGNADKAGRWTEHLHAVYPDDADHITAWCASKVQRPGVKVNHALVLGGAPGIGKDTLLEALKRAVGGHNFGDATPTEVVSRFNGFLKSVVLRISEARDMGDVDRYGLYEHLKIITAAPPDVLRIDEKHTREFYIQNVVGIVYTTNHKSSGIYLPADDRRHYVAWSEATQSDFPESYWRDYYRWYETGGYGHVAAYLHEYDLSGFDPKAPPKKTTAFWEIVDANQAPEDAELADALDALDWPEAVTLQMVREKASVGFEEWLGDRRNARKIPHRFEAAGYVPVRNDAAKDGRFKVSDKRQTIYARKDMGTRDRIIAAEALTSAGTLPF